MSSDYYGYSLPWMLSPRLPDPTTLCTCQEDVVEPESSFSRRSSSFTRRQQKTTTSFSKNNYKNLHNLVISLALITLISSSLPVAIKADNPCTFAVPPGCTTDCAYLAFWNVDPVRGKIRFSISHSITQPNTWSGIGFNMRPSMVGADLVVGWVEEDGRSVLIDSTANGYGQPVEDIVQNVEDSYVSMIDTQQVVEFTRPLYPQIVGDMVYPQNGSCPFFIFPVSGGLYRPGSRNYTKHFAQPLIYGPVCPSVCAVPEFAQRTGTCGFDAVIQRVSNASVESCSSKCLSDVQCQAFDYAADSSTCLLRSGACLSQALEISMPNRFTYEKMTRHDYTRTTGECFGNEVFGQQQITTLQRCSLACNTLTACQAFTYNPFTNECSPQTLACQDSRGSVVNFVYTKIFDQGQKADVFFTFDLTTASTSPLDFDNVKQFLVQFIQLSTIGPNAFLVGGMTYSCIDGPQTVISLNSYVDKKQLTQAMMSLPYNDLSANRALAEKIRYSRSHAFSQSVGNRADALNYVVVISQCPLNDSLASIYESNAAKEDGINVVVVCIGQISDWESVRDVSNIPNGVLNPLSYRAMMDGVIAKQLYDLIIMRVTKESEENNYDHHRLKLGSIMMSNMRRTGPDGFVTRRRAFSYPVGAFDALNDPYPQPNFYSVTYEECQGPECNLPPTSASTKFTDHGASPTSVPTQDGLLTSRPSGPYTHSVPRSDATRASSIITKVPGSVVTGSGGGNQSGVLDQTTAISITSEPTSVTQRPFTFEGEPEYQAIPMTTICFGDRGSLICGFNQQITAVSAHFGRTGYETETTCQSPNPIDCSGEEIECSAFDVYPYVSQVCAGKSACDLKMNSWTLAAMSEQCPGLQNCSVCQQYLNIAYLCTGQKCINNDLYFTLDFSRESITANDLSVFREFLQLFIRKLGISPFENQAGVIYQSLGPVFRPLKSNPSQQELIDFLTSVSYSSLPAGTTNQPLRLSLETLTTDGYSPVSGGRSGANRIAMIFSSTQQSGNLRDTADRLKVAGITPIFIALGSLPSQQTANDLGVSPAATMFLTNFTGLNNPDVLDSLISKVLCSRAGGSAMNVCDEQVDLVFGLVFAQTLISRESFEKLKVFLKEAANYFNVQQDKVRIGIFQHDMFPEFVINLRSGGTRDILLQQIDQLEYFRYGVNGADIPLSIQYARTHAYTLAAGGRQGVRKVLVLMSTRDPNDADATKFEVQTGSRELGLDIIAVGIGAQVSAGGLMPVASRPTGVVLVGSTNPAELRQPIMNAYTTYTCRAPATTAAPSTEASASLADRLGAKIESQLALTVQTCSILQGRVHMTYKDGYIHDPTQFKNPSASSNYTGQIAASAGYCTRESCDPIGCRQGWHPIGGRSLRAYSCLPDFAALSSANDQAWCPYFCADSVYKPYLQLDMGGFYDVAGLVFQGRRKYEHWVTKFSIMHSLDGSQWDFVSESGALKVFDANANSRDVVLLTLGNLQFHARFIRLIVVEFHGIPAMHVDVLRCPGESECPAITVKNSNVDHQPTTRGSSITVTCDDDWMTPFGETSYRLSCDLSGVWGQIKHCTEPRECRGFPFVEFAVHNGRNLRVGSTVTYTCLGRRTLVGNSTVMCQLNRDFTAPPSCQELPPSR